MSNEIQEKIQKSLQLRTQIENLEAELELLRSEISVYMTTKGLKFYEDPSGNVVTYKEQVRESLDKSVIKSFLTPEQLTSATKTTTFGVLKIMTKEQREALQSNFKPKKLETY